MFDAATQPYMTNVCAKLKASKNGLNASGAVTSKRPIKKSTGQNNQDPAHHPQHAKDKSVNIVEVNLVHDGLTTCLKNTRKNEAKS
jgi:hypothetical protein